MLVETAQTQFLERIADAPVSTDPFAYLVARDIFPADYYEKSQQYLAQHVGFKDACYPGFDKQVCKRYENPRYDHGMVLKDVDDNEKLTE